MRIKSSNKIKLDSILSTQNVKCKVTKGRQILSGHPNLTYATTLLLGYQHLPNQEKTIWIEMRRELYCLEKCLGIKLIGLCSLRLIKSF